MGKGASHCLHHHPDRHRHHHQVFRQGNETERHLAASSDAGTAEIALLHIDRLETETAPTVLTMSGISTIGSPHAGVRKRSRISEWPLFQFMLGSPCRLSDDEVVDAPGFAISGPQVGTEQAQRVVPLLFFAGTASRIKMMRKSSRLER